MNVKRKKKQKVKKIVKHREGRHRPLYTPNHQPHPHLLSSLFQTRERKKDLKLERGKECATEIRKKTAATGNLPN